MALSACGKVCQWLLLIVNTVLILLGVAILFLGICISVPALITLGLVLTIYCKLQTMTCNLLYHSRVVLKTKTSFFSCF